MTIYAPLRFTVVPWISNALDLRAADGPVCELTAPALSVKGWRVMSPWGKEDALVMIRAVRGDGRDGGVITMSIEEVPPAVTMSATPVRVWEAPDREDTA